MARLNILNLSGAAAAVAPKTHEGAPARHLRVQGGCRFESCCPLWAWLKGRAPDNSTLADLFPGRCSWASMLFNCSLALIRKNPSFF
jgi:hypothetical protein